MTFIEFINQPGICLLIGCVYGTRDAAHRGLRVIMKRNTATYHNSDRCPDCKRISSPPLATDRGAGW